MIEKRLIRHNDLQFPKDKKIDILIHLFIKGYYEIEKNMIGND